MTTGIPVNILVVDDHEENIMALEAVLANLGHNLVLARSGAEALRCVLKQDFAVIVLDIMMPEMDGFETAALIRARERSRATPIIFLTAIGKSETDIFRGYSVGAVDYLFKPFVPEIMRAKVSAFVDLYVTREQVRQQANQVAAINQTLKEEVAQRRRAETIAKYHAAQLEALNKELEAFAYSVSHDLRAPLRAMQGFAQALLEDYANRLDSIAQDYAQRIVAATRRMDTLMQDLLAYSRLTNAELHLQPIRLTLIVAEAQAQLQENLQEREARLTVEEPLPRVVGHPATLIQVVANLLANAAKFVAPGVQPQVRVWAEERGQRTRLWVEDNGIGIESEHQDRIFRVFERLHSIETYPGTGIGLAIVRKGIERMGGLVGVQSEPGRGSRFWIELPRSEQTHEHADAHDLTGRG